MAVDLWEVALGFMDAQALLSAEELGVFDVLDDGPRTAAEVAEAVGIPEDPAERLLIALCALEVLEKHPGERYGNGPEAAEKLVRGGPGYIGSMFHHVRDVLYPAWEHCTEALRSGHARWDLAFGEEGVPTANLYEDPEGLRAFMEGMHAITYKAAAEFAERADALSGVERMVDVGGASGAFLIALAERFPQLRGTVFDLPAVEPIAEDFFRRNGMEDRLDFHAGSFWDDPLPEGADAYSLGFILHDWNTEGGSRILRKITEAARPGALLVIGEYLLNDERTGPLHVARQSLNMLLTAQGKERSAREYAEWLREFGWELREIQFTGHGKNFMVARLQPAASPAEKRPARALAEA